jgi:hypothetical protein
MAVAPDEVGLVIANQLGGEARAVAVVDQRVYLAAGPRLLVLDVSNPATPLQIGQSELLPAVTREMVVANGFAYVLAADHHLYILDLTNAADPRLVGSMFLSEMATNLAIRDTLLFVSEGERQGEVESGRLLIVDVNNPAAPVALSHVPFDLYIYGIIVHQELVYLAAGSQLLVLWVVDGQTVAFVEQLIGPFYGVGGIVVGDRLYMTGGNLAVFDVTEPERPVFLSNLLDDVMVSVGGVAVDGTTVYAAQSGCDAGCGSSLKQINAANMNQTEAQMIWLKEGRVQDLTMVDGFLYLVTTDGLHIFDGRNPTQVVEIAQFKTFGTVNDLIGWEEVVYAGGGGDHGLYALEASQPELPVYLYEIPDLSWSSSIGLDEAQLYGFTGFGTVWLINLATREVTPFAAVPWAYSGLVVVANGHSYFAADNQLSVSQLSDPDEPREVGQWTSSRDEDWRSLLVQDGYAYLTGQNGTLSVVDVSNPADMREVGMTTLPGASDRLIISNGYGYAIGDNCRDGVCRGKLFVLDVTNPILPQHVATWEFDLGGWLRDGLVVGNRLYLADGDVMTLDISDPLRPRLLERLITSGWSARLLPVGNTLYVADGEAGLLILQPAE